LSKIPNFKAYECTALTNETNHVNYLMLDVMSFHVCSKNTYNKYNVTSIETHRHQV